MSDSSQNSVERVLILDDEEMVLTSLRSFLELDNDYVIVNFSSPTEAIEYTMKNKINLVVSDYLMPEMDGISFLAKVKEIDPNATRIILTGYADKENAIKAINEVSLFQYIEKPWDNDNLKLVIRNGIDKQKLLNELASKVVEIKKAYGDLENLHVDILKAFA